MNNTKLDPSHLERFRTSGLSQASYCKTHGLKQATLAYWLSKSRPGAGFVAVVPQPRHEWLSLQWGSGGVRLKLNVDLFF
jgi:hypothetical protein